MAHSEHERFGLRGALGEVLTRLDTAVCVFDTDGRYLLLNEAAEAIVGRPRGELLGRSFRDVFAYASTRAFDEVFRAVIADGTTRHVRVEHFDRHVEIELASAAGAVLCFWRDVTDRVRGERELQAERDRWRRLFDAAPAQIGVSEGPDHRYIFVNEQGRAAVGGRTDLIGKTAREAYPELAGSPLWAILENAFRTGEPWTGREVPIAFAGPDGRAEERFYTFVYQPYRDGTGDVAGIMTFGFDVSDTVRARRRLETLFSTNLVGNVYWHLDGRITGANDAFLEMVGYTREELTRGLVSWRDLTPPEHAAVDARAMEIILRDGRHAPIEKEFFRKDGSRVPVLVSASFFPDSRREGVSYIVDLTAVKAAESQIGELLREARAASRAKDEFLAMLGHELRNPLAPITTAVELLRRRGGAGPEVEVLERQVGHMSRLVDDLLDVSRIARGDISIDRTTLDLRLAVARAVEIVGPLATSRGHELTVELPESPVLVSGDETRLAQAISNLLVNSARYTEPGGRVAVALEVAEGEARVCVRDTGRGIDPERLDAIFELFVRGEASGGGLGLGLPIVRNLARLHGGEVSARSNGPGRGSEFSLRLPLLAGAPVEPTPLRGQPPRAPSRRVLVVDDNADAADLLAHLIGLEGHEVHVAYSGEEALRVAEASAPRLAFLDLGLPDVDGYEVARRLRERLGADVRLIALSGWGQDRDRERTRSAGFDAHLVKPARSDEVLAALRTG